MARVGYLSSDDLQSADRELLSRPINVHRALANRPEVLRPFLDLGEWVRWRSAADPRRREYVILAVGVAARCRYEVAHHIKIALDFGATDAELDELFRWFASPGSAALPEADRIAVSAAHELASSADLRDETWASLISAVGQQEALDLLCAAAYYSMAVRLLHALDVDNEEEYEPYARRFDDLIGAQAGSARGRA